MREEVRRLKWRDNMSFSPARTDLALKLLRKTNLDPIFSESISGTIAHKKKKKIMAKISGHRPTILVVCQKISI
jgi:hypothetical protein